MGWVIGRWSEGLDGELGSKYDSDWKQCPGMGLEEVYICVLVNGRWMIALRCDVLTRGAYPMYLQYSIMRKIHGT